jgi:hypothetical protein
MHPITTYTIRPATAADGGTLELLATLDSRRPLTGEILVAEVDGSIVAALSLVDRRAAADPFRDTADAVALLRARADALAAINGSPLLRERLRAAVRVARARSAQPAGGATDR